MMTWFDIFHPGSHSRRAFSASSMGFTSLGIRAAFLGRALTLSVCPLIVRLDSASGSPLCRWARAVACLFSSRPRWAAMAAWLGRSSSSSSSSSAPRRPRRSSSSSPSCVGGRPEARRAAFAGQGAASHAARQFDWRQAQSSHPPALGHGVAHSHRQSAKHPATVAFCRKTPSASQPAPQPFRRRSPAVNTAKVTRNRNAIHKNW
mmetsp:Transcript_89598/g.240293  ORF Transcript_89598/g.240293 Transcript_89598/m.240293 type:complete len:205 (-) Transcript_89598:188-802(-)